MSSAPSVSERILEVRDISLSFKGVKAINALSFDVRRGEICALIGPNGAGKSSLLNILNGVYRPDSGEVVFEAEHFRRIQPLEAARRGIGRTFQNNALFKKMSVLDNLLTGLSRHTRSGFLAQALGLPGARREARQFREQAESILEFLELQPWRDVAVGSLAYGLQKRVELARALIARPRLLLLDEPMAGMGIEESQRMIALLVSLKRKHTIILVEHDMDAVFRLADRISVLVYGRVIATDTPENIRRNDEVRKAYLGSEA